MLDVERSGSVGAVDPGRESGLRAEKGQAEHTGQQNGSRSRRRAEGASMSLWRWRVSPRLSLQRGPGLAGQATTAGLRGLKTLRGQRKENGHQSHAGE